MCRSLSHGLPADRIHDNNRTSTSPSEKKGFVIGADKWG